MYHVNLAGWAFALTAAMAWGLLPVTLKPLLSLMDSQTIVFYRFLVAMLALFVLLTLKAKLPAKQLFRRSVLGLLLLGVVGLAGNFWLFNASLYFIEPAMAQIFIHLSSFLMLICGVWVFKEPLGQAQKWGLGVLMVGLGLFFNDRLGLLTHFNQQSLGVMMAVAAPLMWVGYGLAQKLLLRRFSSQQILLLIYLGCFVLFLPVAKVGQVQSLSGVTLICFIFCCLNTLIGYGAYAEALNRWQVSKVSVVITLVPLFTIAFGHLFAWLLPVWFVRPELNGLSYIGALVVVMGAMLSAIGGKRR